MGRDRQTHICMSVLTAIYDPSVFLPTVGTDNHAAFVGTKYSEIITKLTTISAISINYPTTVDKLLLSAAIKFGFVS